ncbi:hypothetical protein [Flavihumibacter fluvii]|uniref:hypothetical protein n=1 Tax=Flavihumibacter fluvii TaxID=2838157 RepID=UPI001BDF4657|nr:hypothetical protein [Flavihumibacter fluvii]ULQ50756.1 hypothetical protein KJS93_11750 [Flavihumibacter fluvii]
MNGTWQNTSPAAYMSNLYDQKGRLVQVQSKNITWGSDIATTLYCFNGSVAAQVLVQNNAVSGHSTEILTRQNYDDLWQVTQIDKKLKHPQVNGGVIGALNTFSQIKYDALRQATKKTLGNTLAVNDYQYSIRGWLLNINKDFVSGTATNKFFGMELGSGKHKFIGTAAVLFFTGKSELPERYCTLFVP